MLPPCASLLSDSSLFRPAMIGTDFGTSLFVPYPKAASWSSALHINWMIMFTTIPDILWQWEGLEMSKDSCWILKRFCKLPIILLPGTEALSAGHTTQFCTFICASALAMRHNYGPSFGHCNRNGRSSLLRWPAMWRMVYGSMSDSLFSAIDSVITCKQPSNLTPIMFSHLIQVLKHRRACLLLLLMSQNPLPSFFRIVLVRTRFTR